MVASLWISTSTYLDQLIPQTIESSGRDLSGNENPSTIFASLVCSYVYREEMNRAAVSITTSRFKVITH